MLDACSAISPSVEGLSPELLRSAEPWSVSRKAGEGVYDRFASG